MPSFDFGLALPRVPWLSIGAIRLTAHATISKIGTGKTNDEVSGWSQQRELQSPAAGLVGAHNRYMEGPERNGINQGGDRSEIHSDWSLQ